MKKKISACVSILPGAILFLIMLPMQFSIYIPKIHSVISITLIAATSILLSIVIYKLITKTLLPNTIVTLLPFTVILGIAHNVYTVMFWSSWICFALLAITLIGLIVAYFTKKKGK